MHLYDFVADPDLSKTPLVSVGSRHVQVGSVFDVKGLLTMKSG